MRRLMGALTAFALTLAVAEASDTRLTGGEGHPRSRFPLGVHAAALAEPTLDAAVRRAVADWNAVGRAVLGVQAFYWADTAAGADVAVEFDAASGQRLMGETRFAIGEGGVIELPVRIVVFEPRAWGETAPETLLYQVLAHELGHTLGLAHVADPRSLMCCDYGAVDLKDPAVREAYIQARRHPAVGSAKAQLTAHYERFWKRPP